MLAEQAEHRALAQTVAAVERRVAEHALGAEVLEQKPQHGRAVDVVVGVCVTARARRKSQSDNLARDLAPTHTHTHARTHARQHQ